MLHRSAGKPILIGLGAAAILAAGAVPVLAAPPQPPGLPAELSTDGKAITVPSTLERLSEEAGFTGVTVKATIGDAPATLDTTCPGGATPADDVCDLGAVQDATATISYRIALTGDIAKDTVVTLTVTATFTPEEGEPETTEPRTTKITFQAPDPEPTPTPTKPTPTPTKPSPTPTDEGTDDEDDDDSDSSSSDSESGSSGGSSYTPPVPNATFGGAQSPRIALPPPLAPPSPSVAPQSAPVPQSRLQNNKAPVAQDLTFERMASTQVAWLAALLVAFSVLLTQLRLGGRRGAPGRAYATSRRPVGAHRRPRRGLFGE
ncbi:hypothetical protein Acsp03_70550 [Actinomadura sp. NBRC 104412]|uniref:hypothetical protein n=1 Tax=Actinomadura sp. NBRC 104412 TaxID=3032203 RepID=UPI0024A1B373|nr:hypothetical protein [Actinomadura sp. NBRC 104412]GLZ09589.1 hypothetical protein Acsp03_70550 [Actinomadura sp. NBRC 104412]